MLLTTETCGAVILAGGKSSRMGSCKALLPRNGETTMLQFIHSQLTDFSECVLSANDPGLEGCLPVPTVRDIYKNCGPMAGIHAALAETQKEALFVVSCDLPFFCGDLPKQMLQAFPEDADAMVCTDAAGKIHPLCGIYRRRILPEIEEMLNHGNRKMMLLLERVNCACFDMPPQLPESMLYNMNTPEDYREYLEAAKA